MKINNIDFKQGRSRYKRKRRHWRRRIKKNYSPGKCKTICLLIVFILMPFLLQAKELNLYTVTTGRKEHDLYAAITDKKEQGSHAASTVQEALEIFTIQTGSFLALESAQTQFDSIMLKLDEKELDHLRIEKIGRYYAVRLGRFNDRSAAEEYLKSADPQLSGAIVLRADILHERLISIHVKSPLTDDAGDMETPVSAANNNEMENAEPLQKSVPEHANEIVPGETAGSSNADTLHTVQAETSHTIQDVPEQHPETAAPPVQEVRVEKTEFPKKQAPDKEKSFIEKIKGRVYVSDYYSVDSSDYTFHILTGRLNLYKLEEKKQGLFFKFDGKARKKIVNGDSRAEVPEYKVRELWAGYKFPGLKWKAIVGRQYINQLYNTYLDGLNINYTFENDFGLGIFGGLAPDKYDDSLNPEFQSVGGYGFLDKPHHKISFGYEHLRYKGETDREYYSARAYSRLSKKFRLNALSSVSKNQLSNDYEVETTNANLLYSHSRKLRFNVFYNYYRTIKYYESSKYYFEFSDLDDSYFLDNNSQTRTGLRVDYKILKWLKVYASGSYQKRKIDNEDAARYTGGIRAYDLLGFDLSARYTYLDNYSSRNSEYNFEIHRNILNKLDVSLYVSREEEKLDLENAFSAGALTYGGSLYWPVTKKIFLSMFIEHIEEDDYDNTSFFTQIGYKF